MDKNNPKRIYSFDCKGNTTLEWRRTGETAENSDSSLEQVSNAMSAGGPSVNARKSNTSLSSSTSTDTLKDAEDLLTELDRILPSTSKDITEHTTSNNDVEKKSTLRAAEKNDDEDENSAENTENSKPDARPRMVSDADVDIEVIVKVSEEIQDEISQAGPSVNARKSDTPLSSSISTDTLKDAEDLLTELDSILPSTSKGITEHTTSNDDAEKKSTLRAAEKNDDEDENSAENTEIGKSDDRTRMVSDADVNIEEIAKVSEEIQDKISHTNVIEAHGLAENIIDTAYGSETDMSAAQLDSINTNKPKVCVKDDDLEEKVDISEAVDLTQILPTVKNDNRGEDERIWEKVDIDKSVRPAGSIVISVPSAIMVTSGNQNVAPTLPGEVFEASNIRKKAIVMKHTEIDNDDDGQIRKKKRKMKALKKLFCGCFREKKETKVESVSYGMRQAEEGVADVKTEKVVFDKVDYFGEEAEQLDEFLHFDAFDEKNDTCFRKMWKRVRGCTCL